MNQQDILAKLGLTEPEQKAYITLLAMGQLSDGELAKYSNLSLREVIDALSQLKEKGLAHEIEGITAKWVASYPFKGMSESIKGLKVDLDALSTDLDGILKSRVTEYKSYSEHVQKEMGDKLDETKRSLNISTETMKEDFEKFTDSFVEKATSDMSEQESYLLQTIESSLEAVKNQISNINSRIQEVLGEATKSAVTSGAIGSDHVNSKANQLATSLLGKVDEFETKTRELSTTHLDSATTVLEQGRAVMNDALTSSLQKVNTTLEGIRAKIESMAIEQSRALTGVGETAKTDAMEFADKRQAEIQSHLGSIQDQTAAILAENTAQLAERAGHTQTKLNDDANQVLTRLRGEADTVVGDLQSKANNIVHALETTTAQILQTFRDTMNAGIEEFNTAIQQQRTLFAENIETTLQSFETSLTTTTQEFSTDISTIIGAIQGSSKEAVDSIVSEQTQITSDETTRFKENMERTIDQAIEQTHQLSLKVREDSNNLVKGTSGEAQEVIDSAKSTISQLAEQIRQSHNQSITDQLTHLGTTVTEQKEIVETSLVELQNDLNATLTEFSSKIETTNQALQDSVNQLVAKRFTDLETTRKGIGEKIQQTTRQITEKLQMDTTSLQTKAVGTVNGSDATATEAIDSAQTTIGAGIQAQIDTLITKLQDFSEQFSGKVLEVSNIVGITEASLGTLWDIVQSYERAPVFTAILLGKESIITYMERMLEEVKSTITLVTPSYQLLPIDAIKSVKSAARVSILTTVDPTNPDDREFIRDLYEKSNIRVRTIQREQIEYWACDRDSEECVLAPARPERPDAELVGVATHTKGFIDLLSKVTVGAYLMGLSQEIRRSDVDM